MRRERESENKINSNRLECAMCLCNRNRKPTYVDLNYSRFFFNGYILGEMRLARAQYTRTCTGCSRFIIIPLNGLLNRTKMQRDMRDRPCVNDECDLLFRFERLSDKQNVKMMKNCHISFPFSEIQ